MGDHAPRQHPAALFGMEHVKCRTAGRSSPRTERTSARNERPSPVRGETGRGAPLYMRSTELRSGVLVGVFFTPTGCPAASDAFDLAFWRVTGQKNLIQGNKVPQPIGMRVSEELCISAAPPSRAANVAAGNPAGTSGRLHRQRSRASHAKRGGAAVEMGEGIDTR